jgi:hypothetical protein
MSNDTVIHLTERIRAAPDMKDKALIAGLAHAPVTEDGIEKSCDNCIYFLPRSLWCELPELNIPVDGDWFCDLWRV